jgi:DNA-directed RNA polymerase specialized sigma24 family protein
VEADFEMRSAADGARASLMELTPAQRESLSLVYFEGLTHREPADALGILWGPDIRSWRLTWGNAG